MAHYRIYSLDESGRIAGVIESEFECDDAALAAAREAIGRDTIAEVWNLGRLLGQVHGECTPPIPRADTRAAAMVSDDRI